MEPFSPQDPVHKLLGKARPVEPRPNFTQNVLRAVRSLPQRLSLWERVAGWLGSLTIPRSVLAGSCAVLLVAGWLVFQTMRDGGGGRGAPALVTGAAVTPADSPAAVSVENEVAATLDDLDQLSSLLVQTDTRAMTDTEVAFLLY